MQTEVEVIPWTSYPDIGNLARWSVSSWKYGFGIECLRDNNPETFWHSEGNQPHSITLEFPKQVAVQKIIIYLDHKKDDSYTPEIIGIRAGTSLRDLQDVRQVNFEKPIGWVPFDVTNDLNEDGIGTKPLYAYVVQLVIVANFMNGKDTHIRGLRVVGPLEEPVLDDTEVFPFISNEFKMYETIR
ncbi:anaphase promoting complex subunit doc1 [Serendipita sp. 401]|nr:anaphase promoting complex subunit doc1 [Serendipita sp. 397]KAG8810442.1 anaphase promoting complex subunit doc1 [Serendipita sp. 401]KAG8817087.1 anaphase promoting complex subunit doc1 [Serendipita sp. 400]KAG8861889.1 anaphase promoting complex subunit doc1 [Serendipita sp. 405]